MQTKPLSNVQKEILKLYSTYMKDRELLELKNALAEFFAKKAILQADNIWIKKGLTDEDMNKWLNDE